MKQIKIPLIVAVVATLLGIGLIMVPRTTTGQPPALADTVPPRTAPGFRLTDQFGRSVALSQFRGKTVVITFLESRCRQLCPAVADSLHRLSIDLGTHRKQVAILAISTDPEGDIPSSVRQFSRQHGMLDTWRYLVSSREQLSKVWHSYYIYAAPKGASPTADSQHTSATYLLDSRGRERALFVGALDVEALNRDVRILSGLPVAPLRSAIPAPEAGHPALDFTLSTPNGSTTSLHALRGNVVLVNFWATWCKPCRSEMPRIAGWYRRLRNHRFTVLGVDQQEDASAVKAFLQRLHIPYPVALDSSGDVSARYNVAYLPLSVLVDREGYVESVHLGILDGGYLTNHLEPLVGVHRDR